jgi:8-amino-7-oxononanoate synthase
MNDYTKELNIIEKSNRLRTREIFDSSILDMASNDYLGLAHKKKLLKKAFKKVSSSKYFGPKASMLVNGYHPIHKEFEQKLCKANSFEDAIVVGSGFLANVSMIESMVRKGDVLFIDEEYHASGMLATKYVQGEIVVFKHNDFKDLFEKAKKYLCDKYKDSRLIIAVEGIYSMSGDILPKEFFDIADDIGAFLIADEAHSSGVLGENLLGIFDYYGIKPKKNHIKMGTLGKAYGSYGAYILASKHIIKYLENRAKAIIYTTAPSVFDIALGIESLRFIVKNSTSLNYEIKKKQQLVEDILDIKVKGLIVPIEIADNKKVKEIQKELKGKGYLVGAIRQPTVPKAIIRLILRINIPDKELIKVLSFIKSA